MMYRLLYPVLTALIFTCSCGQQKQAPAAAKNIKTVPLQYTNTTDAAFSSRQDTLFYNGSLYSGHVFQLCQNGDTAFTGSYLNGLEEGVFKKWYASRQLQEVRTYIDGKKEGVHRGWWQDGTPKFDYHFYNGEHHGELKEWYSSGQPYRYFHYTNGYEEGSQKIWWDNGTIRANYVVRNGKKYGLIGLKLCSNPHDSIVKK